MAEQNHDRTHYESAANLIRVHGIISIIFGAIGVSIGLFLLLLFGFAITEYNDYQVISSFITGVLVFIFAILPHIYLLVSGIHLLRNPRPSVAKTLIIINLVVGVFWNLVILIFAILNLTQFHDYERGYKHLK